ncbi:plasma membrane fusion protein PRM1 [Kwoniella mangroviensis CBS 8886]|nr:plasma membrane fusion protein PRM1 [Kwoniella mangroviensis CBS 8886]
MASTNSNLLQPPQRNLNPNPDHVIPLTPHLRPPFAHYHSSSTLPPTPHTPYSPQAPSNSGESPTRLRPYLSLSPRILLTFFSPYLLPIILTIAHMFQNRSSTASLAASLKQSMLSACSGLAKGAASIQTMPRYLAMQTNEEVVRATQASILAVGSMLMDAVTIIEVVVEFIVDTYRSLLLCTIELVVRGTLEILIAAVDTITDGITTSLNSIREEIQEDIASANNIIQSAVSGINSVTSLVNVNLSVPEFSVPSLDFLANVTIPTGFEDSLIKLNGSLPTMIELKDKMSDLLNTPFEALKQEINETRIEMAANFNSSILPVPSLSQLSANTASDLQNDLCTDLDTSLIDDTAKALHKLSNVAIGLMFLLLFAIWVALTIWEWRKWRMMKNAVEAVEDEWRRENTVDAWRVVAIVENPVLEKYSSGILGRVTKSSRTRTNLRWFLSYLGHPTCLALLFISLLGFLSIQFQLVALDALKTHARENANSTVAASTNSLTTKLNAAAMQSSQEYADQYNAAIAEYQQKIDDELFGSWLNTTAVTLNTTLVEFYDGIEQVLNDTFGGTILYNPINNFMYCILGAKIDNLEKGLTWISEHAHIELPTLPSNILMLSNDSMNEIATPIASAAVGSGSSSDGEEDAGIVGDLIKHFESALKAERAFYGIMIGMWGFLFVVGVIIVIWNSGGRGKYYSIRGKTTPHNNHDSPPTGGSKWIPWLKDTHPIYDTYAEKQFRGTTPTPTTANIPTIIEPSTQGEKSFFEYPDDHKENTLRPLVPRKGTFGSTISSLAAPGQAFLKLAGRKVSSTSTAGHERDDNEERLVEKGVNSEKYNSTYYNDHQPDFSRKRGASSTEPGQTFWVDKFYGAIEGVKSIFPTRGQKHGASLNRNGSQRTENSFGASQVPTARTQQNDWPSYYNGNSDSSRENRKDEPEWTMINPQSIGRALANGDLQDEDGRYSTNKMIYPRPMSRAPTLSEGMVLPKTHPFHPSTSANPFENLPPSLPPKPVINGNGNRNGSIDNKHDSIDYLQSEDEDSHDQGDNEERLMSIISPSTTTSSIQNYMINEQPKVQSVNKVQLKGMEETNKGTTALAGILQELQEKMKRQVELQQGNRDREGEVFSDSRRII